MGNVLDFTEVFFFPPLNHSLWSQGNEAVSYTESNRAALLLAC